MADSPDAREIELKLDIGVEDAARWRESGPPLPGIEARGVRHFDTTYFDTEDHSLSAERIVLRIRRDGERRIQTAKAEDEGGSFDRIECEAPVAGDEPDLDAITDAGLRERIMEAGDLRPLFRVAVERTIWTIAYGSSELEIVLDQGEVAAGDAKDGVREVEIELKSGEIEDLFAIARILADQVDLGIGVLTKAERGFRLLAAAEADGPVGPIKADPLRLTDDLDAATAFQIVARASIRHFRLNEPRVSGERFPGALHQCRVALRRLRAAFTIFEPLIGDETGLRLKSELRAVSRLLGDARNLDVYLARLDAHAADHPLEAGLGDLKEAVRRQRDEAYGRVEEMLASRPFRRMMLDLVGWIECGPWLAAENEALAEPVEDFAARILGKRRRKVVRRSRDLAALDPEHRHEVRIEAKKLRYATEFFAGLYEKKKARKRVGRFLEALEEIQESLGDLNDIATARDLAGSLVGGSQPEVAEVAQRVTSGQAEQAPDLLARAIGARENLKEIKRFWE